MESTSAKTRILVIDDSIVARRMVARVIDSTPDLTVAATAANGRIGLAKLSLKEFDAVVLDVEMPELDGLETLAEIRKTHPRLPVIMFSSLTRRGAETTLDALTLGANDYVTKPTADASGGGETHVAEQLVPRLRALCSGPQPLPPSRASSARPPSTVTRLAPEPARALAVGSSTGGPNVLAEIIPQLPKALPVPVFIVQHMPPVFTRLLAERLDAMSAVSVVEARSGDPVRPGVVYVAAGDHHLEVRVESDQVVLDLDQGPRENSCRPAVDVLFRSLAGVYGSRVTAVVLTGMGKDGLEGARALVEAGSRVLVQDEASSVVWGMPGFVAREGLAEAILSPGEIARALVDAPSVAPRSFSESRPRP